MPKTTRQILAHADELAARFENYEPHEGDSRPAESLLVLRQAVLARAETDRQISDAVAAARADGHSWSAVGGMLGTSGEAARQRFGAAVADRRSL